MPAPSAPSDNPDSPAPAPRPAKRRRWWKRLLLGLLILLAILALFHRPIIFAAAKYAARKVGQSEGLKIDFQIRGTIFTGLRIENLRVEPTRPGPVEKANVGLLEVNYSLWTLARGGLSSPFLRNVTLHDVDAILDPAKSPPSPPKKKEAFKLPPLPFPQRLSLRNVNFLLRPSPQAMAKAQAKEAATSSMVPAPVAPAVAGATQAVSELGLLISKLNLELDPDHAGELRIGQLRIPAGPDLRDIHAKTSYLRRNLQLTDLALAPEIRFRTLGVDASKLDTQRLGISLDGDFFGGRAAAAVNLYGIGVPPKASVSVKADGISFASVHDFFKIDVPMNGALEKANVQFDGASDRPDTWVGLIEARLSQPVFGPAALDGVDLRVRMRNGVAEVEQADIAQGANRVEMRAKSDLPPKIEDLPRSGGRGTIKVTIPDFAHLPVTVPIEMAGSLNANGEFTIADARLTSSMKGRIRDFRAPQQRASIAAIDFATELTKTLPADATAPAPAPNTPPPPDEPFFKGLTTRSSADLTQVQYDAYKIDVVRLVIVTDQAAIRLEKAEVLRGDNRLALEGDYQLPVNFADWQKNPLALRLDLTAPTISQFSADQAAAPLQGRLEAKGNLALQNGVYEGAFNLGARNLRAKGAKVETADVHLDIQNSRVVIRDSRIRFDEKNTIDINGKAALQAPFPFEGGVNVNMTDLSFLEPILQASGVNETKLGGSVRIVGHANGRLASQLGANDQVIDGSVELTARDVQAKGAKIEAADALIVVKDNRATIQKGQVRLDAKSNVTFGGQADLQAPHHYQGNLNIDLSDLVAFEPLLRANGVNEKLGGSVKIVAQAQGKMPSQPGANDQALDGKLQISALNLQAKGARVERIDGLVLVDGKEALIKQFQIRVNEKNTVDLGGQAAIHAPFDYQANLNVNLSDLKVFEPILRAAGANKPPAAIPPAVKASPLSKPSAKPVVKNPPARLGRAATVARTAPGAGKKPLPGAAAAKTAPTTPTEPHLAGSVQLLWQAKGNFAREPENLHYSGNVKLAARKVEFNAVGPIEADVAGDYSPQLINFPTFAVNSNGVDLRGVITHKDAILRVDKISLKQGQTELLAGYIQLPLDPQKLSAPGGPIPDVDKIDVKIDTAKPIALETLFASLDKSKPALATGTLQLGILARGRISKLVAEVKVQGRQLRAPQQSAISPADLDVSLRFHDNRLDLDTAVRQPQIQTLTVKGNIPLDPQAAFTKKEIDPKTPVTLSIQLPRSSLGFLARTVPAIRFIEGDASADIRVGGTVEHPTFSGLAQLNIPAVRMQNITVPAVRDFQARLAFTEKQFRFERFNGEIGGGKLNVEGRVDFVKLTEPALTLAIKAENVLAKRDDNVTARVNADVKITGPLASATVAGYVGITKSRYLKDIDILPIGLPGKPAPAPPAQAVSDPTIGVNIPPVKDWKFDLVIKTDDPFFVRGNLANGQALVDLRLRGTGAEPLLDGTVQVENLTASLPFSRLDINTGNINFTPDQPLNPVIDLRGTSEIRNYLISVYISGRAKDPKVLFTSEPPLPQEQIVSLLATGATTDELTGNTEALAGKATLLVLQDVYRRTFKKKSSSSRREPQTTLADRVNFDLGAIDPATGKQQVGARFKITDQVQFLGDLGLQGDIRGRVKYLVRFR